jgi:hypothetical protein
MAWVHDLTGGEICPAKAAKRFRTPLLTIAIRARLTGIYETSFASHRDVDLSASLFFAREPLRPAWHAALDGSSFARALKAGQKAWRDRHAAECAGQGLRL